MRFGALKYSVLFILALRPAGFSQNARVDSLKAVLREVKADTHRIVLLNEMCRYYAYHNPDTALILTREAFALARTDEKGGIIASTCMFAGISCNNLGKRDSAEFYFNRAILIAHRHKKTSIEAASYMGLGTCYNFWKKQDKALQNYLTSYNMYKTMGDSGRIAAVALGIGNVYSDLNNINKALEFFNLCLHYSEARNDKAYMAKCYNNIGNLFQKNKNYEKALAYYSRSMDIKKSLNDEHGIANTYLNFGNIYTYMGKIDLAKSFYQKARAAYSALGDSAEYMNTLAYLAECLLIEKNPNEALVLLEEAEGICRRNNYPTELAGIYSALTRIYILKGDTAMARKSLDNYTAAKDSLLYQDMNRRIAEMTAQFESDKQKQELTQKETELKSAKKLNTFYIISTIIFCILLVGLLMVILKLKKANRTLLENSKMPDKKNGRN